MRVCMDGYGSDGAGCADEPALDLGAAAPVSGRVLGQHWLVVHICGEESGVGIGSQRNG